MGETYCRLHENTPVSEDDHLNVGRICSLKELINFVHICSLIIYSHMPIFYRSRNETLANGHDRIKPPPWTTFERSRDEWKITLCVPKLTIRKRMFFVNEDFDSNLLKMELIMTSMKFPNVEVQLKKTWSMSPPESANCI
ncbi:hypothetical protein KIN20_003005 [Parelaphostrongylus tenuis]|uniref:Uncharacterized protein n=1 Tax=Parelaphostrongylus tenuis TaxID=148309 RepID=A0AAD5MHN5_PARTN|nr:hypothetical protein KIN20_003005 [Parelaphostrongylus tenuis]